MLKIARLALVAASLLASSVAALAQGPNTGGGPGPQPPPSPWVVQGNAVTPISGLEILAAPSTAAHAGLNLPHGVAPTSPVNGDLWTTTGGLFARINGATIGPFLAGPQATTINSVSCPLGGSCTISGSATSMTIGTTTVLSGSTTRVLYDNAGVLGEYPITGSGSVVLSASPTITSPTITGAFTATGLVTVADLANPSVTVNGATCTLGSTCSPPASSIVVGTTAVTSGTGGDVLYNNGGILGNLPVTGSAGNVVLSISPTLTTLLRINSSVTLGLNLNFAQNGAFPSLQANYYGMLINGFDQAGNGFPGMLQISSTAVGGVGAAINLQGGHGTFAALTALNSGDVLGQILGNGYNGSAWTTSATYIEFIATQNWSSSAEGTKIIFGVTANGATSPSVALTINQDNSLMAAGPVSASNLSLGGTLTTSAALTTTGAGAPTLAFPSSGFTYTFPGAAANLAYQVGALTSGHCLQASGTAGGVADAGAACGSGGGTPGGASGTIQWNNGGAFAGVTNWTTAGTNDLTGASGTTLAVGGATIGSNALAVTGTALFGSTLVCVTANTGCPALPGGSPYLQVVGSNTQEPEVLIDGFAHKGIFNLRRADGTFASPTALVAGDTIGAVLFSGYNGSTYNVAPGAQISANATETWASNTNKGTELLFFITPTGTFTAVNAVHLYASGGVGIGNGTFNALAGNDPGSGVLNIQTGVLLSGGATALSGVTLVSASTSSPFTVTVQAATDTLVGRATADALTNKTLTSSTNSLGGVTAAFGSDAKGDIYQNGGSSNVVTRLGVGSTNNVMIVSGGLAAWGQVALGSSAAVSGQLAVANGGTNCSAASGTCLDNITGFSSTGFIKRTGAGTYTFAADPSDVTSVFGRTGAVVATSGDYAVAQVTGAAPLASPTFTGTVTMPDSSTFGTNFAVAGNAILTGPSAATLHLGAADAAAPVAQTVGAQGVVAGISNTAGALLTIAGSQGTGTGAGGAIQFQVAPAGSTGTSQNALVNSLYLAATKTSASLNSIPQIALGTTSPSSSAAAFVISANATAPPAAAGNALIHLLGKDSTSVGLSLDTFAQQSFIAFRRSEGPNGTPTATASGVIGGIQARGYDTAYTAARGLINFTASQLWASGADGLQIDFSTTANSTTTTQINMRLQNSGGLTLGNSIIATDPGQGALLAKGTIRSQAQMGTGGYTVSTLPASPSQGDFAFVTDAVACTFLAALTGGGSTVCPVFYNGTAWVGA
jgi:hypothetical protein